MAKLETALVLGASAVRLESSNLSLGIDYEKICKSYFIGYRHLYWCFYNFLLSCVARRDFGKYFPKCEMRKKDFRRAIFIIIVIISLGAVGLILFKKPADWKRYSSADYNFSLSYPGEWTLEEFPQTDLTGRIISLRSPEVFQLLQDYKIDPGNSYNLLVSFWPTINNEYARGGSWIGQRNYSGLDDFFTDENAFKQKIGDITVAGHNAYEVKIGGAGENYGIMIERNGIYELSFSTAWDKSKLGSVEKQILSTFKFLK